MARWVSGLALALAALALASVAAIAAAQAFYPVELNVFEGAMLDHVRRLREGLPIFVEPSADYVPYLYAPGFYWVSAGASFLTGIELSALRLTSILGTGLILASLFVVVRRLSDWRWGVVAAGLYAACFALSYGWYALGRVDNLALGLLCLGIAIQQSAAADRARILAALAFMASIWVKQNTLIAVLPIFCWMAWADRRALLFNGLALALLVVTPFFFWNRAAGGWPAYYMIEVAQSLPIDPDKVWRFFTRDLRPLGPALLLALLAGWKLRPAMIGRRDWLMLGAGAGLLGLAWVSRWHEGGFHNVLMPGFAAIAAAAAVACFRLQARSAAMALVAGLLLAGQFALLAYDPRIFLPASGARDRAARIGQELRALPEPVWLAGRSYWLGKPAGAAPTALNDLRFRDDGHYKRIVAETERRLADGYYGSVVLAQYAAPLWGERLERRYRLAGKLGEGAPAMDLPTTPIPSLPLWPYWVYVRR